jgi:hypothetical protein
MPHKEDTPPPALRAPSGAADDVVAWHPVTTTPTSPQRTEYLDFGQALRFFFQDAGWLAKVLLGGLFVLLGTLIVGWIFVGGYALRVVRRSAAGHAQPLPDFDDWGGFFSDGLKVIVVYLGHLVAVFALPALLMLATLMATGFGAARQQNAPLNALFALGFVAVYGLLLLLGFALYLYLPAAFARLAVEDRVGAAFDVRENLAFIKRNLGNYALTLLLYLLASLVAHFGILLCCVGIFPATFWATCVAAWGLGETIRRDTPTGTGAALSRA